MHELPPPAMPAWLASMLPGSRRYAVEVDAGVQMHVMEHGAGLPVVMVHGNPTWGFLYRKVAAELAGQGFRVILPDLVGLGFSSRVAYEAHTLDRHTAWMTALYEKLALPRAVVVVQDWGGPIGVGALAASRMRAGLVVMNTVLSPPREGFRATAFHRFARVPLLSDLAFRTLAFPVRGMGLVQGDRSSIRGDVLRAYLEPLRDRQTNVAPLALARMVPNDFAHPSIAGLARCHEFVRDFTGPAAIVWGDRDPILGGVRTWMEKCIPHASVTRTRAGHFLQEEVPVPIAAAIRDVAARLEAAHAGGGSDAAPR
jgi:pimeloyl-ACP methyl ester carboxylesterase